MVLKANEISTTDFYKAVETLKQITGIKPGEMVLITAHENVGKTHEFPKKQEATQAPPYQPRA